MQTKHSPKPLEVTTLLATGASYWLHINPLAKRQISHWKARAASIPDQTLRAQATHKLTGERLNPEAAALFAILAPRHARKGLIRLIVAFQIAYDYLDAINEAPDTANLQNGFSLHEALNDAIRIEPPRRDYYKHHPQKDDGGYLSELIAVCRSEIATLPSANELRPLLALAIARCGEAQCRNHAVRVEGEEQLIDWSQKSSNRAGYLWWELSAGGISSLGIHALFAAAAARSTVEEAHKLDAAYFPPVCAISALLDSLVDYAEDRTTTNHSFVGHYRTANEAADRFAAITSEARALLSPLKHPRRHELLLAGIASFYLSANEAQSDFARPATSNTLGRLGSTTHVIFLAMQLMRLHAGVSNTQDQRPKPQPLYDQHHAC